jgi:hypothetical protein
MGSVSSTHIPGSLVVLDEQQWRPLADAHAARVDTWTAGRRGRVGRGQRHPVEDFLFEYYPTRPGQLRRWHPGLGVALRGASELSTSAAYRTLVIDDVEACTVDVARFAGRRDGIAWVEGLLRRTAQRPGRFGCFGLHEWAMVYGLEQGEVRHEAWPLRRSPDEVRAVVDEQGLRCTHIDAYRFFTPDAVPLNELAPTRATQPDLDQPGCLHATMDLYKWSAKYVELVGSNLVAECFALALDARRLDMEAAPYDLRPLGYEPVEVETAEGRAEYVRRQRVLVERAEPLRVRLVDALAVALAALHTRSVPALTNTVPQASAGR